jgi:hypothetical protein
MLNGPAGGGMTPPIPLLSINRLLMLESTIWKLMPFPVFWSMSALSWMVRFVTGEFWKSSRMPSPVLPDRLLSLMVASDRLLSSKSSTIPPPSFMSNSLPLRLAVLT